MHACGNASRIGRIHEADDGMAARILELVAFLYENATTQRFAEKSANIHRDTWRTYTHVRTRACGFAHEDRCCILKYSLCNAMFAARAIRQGPSTKVIISVRGFVLDPEHATPRDASRRYPSMNTLLEYALAVSLGERLRFLPLSFSYLR